MCIVFFNDRLVIDVDAKLSLKEGEAKSNDAKLSPKENETNFNEIKVTCEKQNFYILLAFLLITITLLIAVSIYCYLIKDL